MMISRRNGLSKLTLIGMGAGVLGAVASFISGWVDRKNVEQYIDNRISERFDALTAIEEHDEEDDEDDDTDD